MRNRSVTLAAFWLSVAASCCVVGCKDSVPERAPGDVAPAATGSEHPLDHLAPNELLEGTETAFGLPLPRPARIDHAFPDIVYASAPVPLDALVDYFRTRVRDGSFTQSQYTATFTHVKVPARPGHELQITLHDTPGFRCDVQLRDTTPAPAPTYADEPARWRAQGLKPGGAILDPQHIE
jgi:hypothetical protein